MVYGHLIIRLLCERQMPLRLSLQQGCTMPTLGQLEMLWDAPELVRLLGSYRRVKKEDRQQGIRA